MAKFGDMATTRKIIKCRLHYLVKEGVEENKERKKDI
jgi:hypothetical protein